MRLAVKHGRLPFPEGAAGNPVPPPARNAPVSARILLALICLALAALAAFATGRAAALAANTLERNPRWRSAKLDMARGLMAAYEFIGSKRTLAGERLNLGEWYGFNEVLVAGPPLNANTIGFDYRLDPDAWLACLIDRGSTGTLGIRVSNRPDMPSQLFVADAEGRFVSRSPIPGLAPEAGRWHRLDISLEPDSVRLASPGGLNLDLKMPGRIGSLVRPGFRNGQRPASVDNILIRDGERTVLAEDFAYRGPIGVAAAALALGVTGTLLLPGFRRGPARRKWFRAILFNAVAAASALLLLGFVRLFPSAIRPHVPKTSNEYLDYYRDIMGDETSDELVVGGNPSSVPITRVMLVGASQTWGAGAGHLDHRLYCRLERLLNDPPGGRPVIVMNAAICGLTTPEMLRLYREKWLRLGPDIVVVNASNNDTDAAAFRRALDGFAALNRAHGIETVFVLEANSIEKRPHGLPLHGEMRAAAQRAGAGLIDMHDFLRRHNDDGFLWWDYVHLTSLGQALAAERLARTIRPLLAARRQN